MLAWGALLLPGEAGSRRISYRTARKCGRCGAAPPRSDSRRPLPPEESHRQPERGALVPGIHELERHRLRLVQGDLHDVAFHDEGPVSRGRLAPGRRHGERELVVRLELEPELA